MRLYAPMYEGDSFLRPDAAIGAPGRKLRASAAMASDFVHSNIARRAENLTAPDSFAIEQTARALRNAEVARLLKIAALSVANSLKAAKLAVENWLERVDYEERDRFFASASNLADLEQRQRHWERTGCAHY